MCRNVLKITQYFFSPFFSKNLLALLCNLSKQTEPKANPSFLLEMSSCHSKIFPIVYCLPADQTEAKQLVTNNVVLYTDWALWWQVIYWVLPATRELLFHSILILVIKERRTPGFVTSLRYFFLCSWNTPEASNLSASKVQYTVWGGGGWGGKWAIIAIIFTLEPFISPCSPGNSTWHSKTHQAPFRPSVFICCPLLCLCPSYIV